jgi:hypothetical protein
MIVLSLAVDKARMNDSPSRVGWIEVHSVDAECNAAGAAGDESGRMAAASE